MQGLLSYLWKVATEPASRQPPFFTLRPFGALRSLCGLEFHRKNSVGAGAGAAASTSCDWPSRLRRFDWGSAAAERSGKPPTRTTAGPVPCRSNEMEVPSLERTFISSIPPVAQPSALLQPSCGEINT